MVIDLAGETAVTSKFYEPRDNLVRRPSDRVADQRSPTVHLG
jgi:hypothetical protein